MRTSILAFFVVGITACGGCGGSSSDTPNSANNSNNGGNNSVTLKAVDDAYQLNKGENVLLHILDNDQIADLNSVTLEIPQDEQLRVENKAIRYTAPTSDNFTKTFTYSISDNSGNSSQATVRITAKNNTIGASLDADFDVAVTSVNQSVTIDVLANDISSVNDPLHLTEILNVTSGAKVEIQNNQILYTPAADFSGKDWFTYKVEDESGNSYSGVNVYVLVEAKVSGRYTEIKLGDLASFPIEETGITLTQAYDKGAVTTAPAGDFNGDNISDFIACYEQKTITLNNETLEKAGECYVVFGTRDIQNINNELASNTENKQRIISSSANTRLGYQVRSAGDVNNDGFDDILLFAKASDKTVLRLVLGGAQQANPLVINPIETSNSRIVNFNSNDALVNANAVGDINNDSIDDLAFIFQNNDDETPKRRLVVLFGSNSINHSDMDNLQIPSHGFEVLDNQVSGQFSFTKMLLGSQIVSLGDVNQDNFDDIGLKVVNDINGGFSKKTGAFIFFGQSPKLSFPIHLTTDVGTFISADSNIQSESLTVGAAADFNGDGIKELTFHHNKTIHVYSLTNLTRGEIPINDEARLITQLPDITNWYNTLSMSSLGDINSDGFNDIGILTSGAFAQSNQYVLIYGKSNMPSLINIENLRFANGANGSIGTLIHDEDNNPGTVMGFFSSVIGDFNSDGRNDFIIGGFGDDDYETNGEVTILFGGNHFGG